MRISTDHVSFWCKLPADAGMGEYEFRTDINVLFVSRLQPLRNWFCRFAARRCQRSTNLRLTGSQYSGGVAVIRAARVSSKNSWHRDGIVQSNQDGSLRRDLQFFAFAATTKDASPSVRGLTSSPTRGCVSPRILRSTGIRQRSIFHRLEGNTHVRPPAKHSESLGLLDAADYSVDVRSGRNEDSTNESDRLIDDGDDGVSCTHHSATYAVH